MRGLAAYRPGTKTTERRKKGWIGEFLVRQRAAREDKCKKMLQAKRAKSGKIHTNKTDRTNKQFEKKK